jgi:sec-independent protein translocase protein TatA
MTHPLVTPLFMNLGATELIIVAVILVLLFGAKKLPELARGSGRALRIFKSETKGLLDDEDEDKDATPEQREINQRNRAASEREHEVKPNVRPNAEDTKPPGSL